MQVKGESGEDGALMMLVSMCADQAVESAKTISHQALPQCNA